MEVARALVHEQQLVAVRVAHEMIHDVAARQKRTRRCPLRSTSAALPRRTVRARACSSRMHAVAADLRTRSSRSADAGDTSARRARKKPSLLISRSYVPAAGRHAPGARPCPRLAGARSRRFRSQHSAAHLIQLDRFEQRLEVAFAEAVVALALDDLEEDRPDDVLREDLQQQAFALARIAVDQDAPLLQLVRASRRGRGTRASTPS